MRFWGLIRSLALASFFITVPACGVDPSGDEASRKAKGDEVGSAQVDDQAAMSPAAAADMNEEASAAIEADGVVTEAIPGSGCSYVDYCNAPGSIGTQCVQRQCSLAAAQNECKNEVINNVCGRSDIHCPFMFKTLGGQNVELNCNAAACSGGHAIACGGRCCPTSSTVCGAGGACCDGTCKSGCPC